MKNKVYIVAIFGGSGSGKTTFARKIAESLGPLNVAVIGQDSYYIDQSERFDRDGGAVKI
jgi:uridine kinase